MKNDERSVLSGARALGIVLVVLGHALIGAIREKMYIYDFVWNLIYSFHMFFFFCISGYLFEKNIEKYTKNKIAFVKNKLILLMLPYMVITTLEYGLLFFINRLGYVLGKNIDVGANKITDFFKILIFNYDHFDTHLWYIYVLFFIFLINIFLLKRVKYLEKFVAFLVLLVFWYPYLGYLPWWFQSIIYYLTPFLVGRFAARRKLLNKDGLYTTKKLMCSIGLLLLINIAVIWMTNCKLKEGSLLSAFRVGMKYNLLYLSGLAGTCVLLCLSRIR